MRIAAAVAALAFACLVPLSAAAGEAPPPLCASGVFQVDGEPLFRNASGDPEPIELADGMLRIASRCPAAEAQLRATRKGTRIRARFDPLACSPRRAFGGAGFEDELAAVSWNLLVGWVERPQRIRRARRPLLLRGLIEPGCETLAGTLSAERFRRRFTASTAPCEGCECAENADCQPGSFCAKPEGACSGSGACLLRPAACPDVWLPVCDCEGRTWSNDCEAAAAGASVAHEGVCEAECGTIAGIPCPEGERCVLPPGRCESADLGGVCVPALGLCTQEWDPVCGCDGITYSNDCMLGLAGVTKDHDGECEGAR